MLHLQCFSPGPYNSLMHADPFNPSTLAYHLFSCWIGQRSNIGVAVSTNSETFLYLVGSIGYFDLIHHQKLDLCVFGGLPSPLPIWHPEMQIVSQSQRIQLECFGESCFGKCWILLRSGDMTSFQPNVSPNCPLHRPSNLGMSLLCFFPSYYNAFKEFSRNVPIMLKKVPIMPVCHGKKSLPLEIVSGSFGCYFTRFSGLTVFSSVSTAPRFLRSRKEG